MKKVIKNKEELSLKKLTVSRLEEIYQSKVIGGDPVLLTLQGPSCPPPLNIIPDGNDG